MNTSQYTPAQLADAKTMAEAIASVPKGTRSIFDLMVEAMLVGVMSTKVPSLDALSGAEKSCLPFDLLK